MAQMWSSRRIWWARKMLTANTVTKGNAGLRLTVHGQVPAPKSNRTDPGWYKHPQGTVAYEWGGEVPDIKRPAGVPQADGPELKVRKPSGGHSGH